MQCVDCRTSMIGSIPNHLYNSGRCHKCHKIYEVKMALKEEAEKLVEESKKQKEQVIKEEVSEKEEKMGRFDLIDFD